MSDVIIKIENLSKEYRYGVVSHQYLFKDLQSWWARVRGREDPNVRIALDVGRVTLDEKKDNTKKLVVGKLDATGENIKTSHVTRKTSNGYLSSHVTRHTLNDVFWALRDINLEIKQGDLVGIIGRNTSARSVQRGAGKSTLLKILSRVTAPTTGSIKASNDISVIYFNKGGKNDTIKNRA
jgi:lipopolysaccharide transport system ATP-binding protein